ncbi:MAG TPA: hypothetical protein VIK00_05865, partial [Candidatus Limnocylindrales bacterium]
MTERTASLFDEADGLSGAAERAASSVAADVASDAATPAGRRGDERWFPRLIGLLILGLTSAGAGLMLLATLAIGPAAGVAPTRGFLFGVWSVLYAT